MANLFVIVDPTAGRRQVTVTERPTKADFARQMTHLCDVMSRVRTGCGWCWTT